MIYTITLNPAIDWVLNIKDSLERGKNNRVKEKKSDIGGKGTHVSVGLTLLGEPNICTGCAGEYNFDELDDMLKEYEVRTDFMMIPNEEVRHCYVLTDNTTRGSYMITEGSFPLSKENIDSLINTKLKNLSKEDIVAVSGNPSLETEPKVFEYFIDRLNKIGCKVIADVSGKYLKSIVDKDIYLIKPNEYEFGELIDKKIETEKDVLEYYKNNNDKLKNIKNIVVSLGRKGSVFLTEEGCYIVSSPEVETVNDTGCGDSFVSGLVYGIAKNLTWKETAKIGSAVGAASAMVSTSSGFDTNVVENLKNKVGIKEG